MLLDSPARAASLYVRYLLVPTTLAAGVATLALLSGALAVPLGDHAPTAVLAGGLAVVGGWVGLWERRCPADRVIERRSPRQRRGDVLYTAITAAGVLAWTRGLTWLAALFREGLFGLSLATWPLVAQVIVAFLISEILMFLLHWASHRSGNPLLWHVHAPHHRPQGLSLRTASRAHPVDVAFQSLSLAPAALLGATPTAIVWCFAVQLFFGVFQHADLDIRLGIFNWIVPGPEVHRVHHHIDPAQAESFALNAPLLDLLFGTDGPFRRPGEVPMGVAGEPD